MAAARSSNLAPPQVPPAHREPGYLTEALAELRAIHT
jgi:hypothetical protein